MENVLVIGGKGMQLHPAESLIKIEKLRGSQRFAGFLLDDDSQAERLAPLGPIVGGIHEARAFAERGYKIIFSLWFPDVIESRTALFESLGLPEQALATVIDPTSDVSALASIGPGTYVGGLTHIGNFSTVGRCNFINPQCHITHDSHLGDYNVLAPLAAVHSVTIGDGNFIGMQTLVDAPIGNGNFIGYHQVLREPVGSNALVSIKHPVPRVGAIDVVKNSHNHKR